MEYFPFQGAGTDTEELNDIISLGSQGIISNIRMLEKEINKFKSSNKREWMIKGEQYYEGQQDILAHKRKVIGKGGRLEVAENLPNNKILDNQYAKLVDQKVNYQLGKPLTFESDDKTYLALLQKIFNKRFHRTLRNMGLDALNGGIAWLYPYHNENGEFTFKRFSNSEILPFWRDAEHTVLDAAVRIYTESGYEGDKEVLYEKVEVYTVNGVQCYVWFNGRLVEDVENPSFAYISTTDEDGNEIMLNWQKVPLIPFKFNSKEMPLLKRVKSLQDGINIMLSSFQNNMQEDARSTILILHNYDGQNLGEFRRNLAQFGAVKVRSADGSRGGVESLQVEVNADNYKAILSLFKNALIENGRGYDAKDERMANNPNQMNIQSMYSDIDLDANGIETEFQASFEELLWFINMHLVNTGQGDFEDKVVNVIFNRDVLVNETESIDNAVKSLPILPLESIIAQHPWTTDTKLELDRIAEERRREQQVFDDYRNSFPNRGGVNGEEA